MATVRVPDYSVEEKVVLPASQTAVIVVDMQNDFAHPDGSLFVPKARDTIPKIRKLLDKARKAGVRVIYTQDTHYEGDPEFEIWGEHARYGTWGWEIVEELKPIEGRDIVVRKTRYDGFYGTPMDDLLKIYQITHLVVTGTVANICVLHTAGSAALRWYKVVVPMDAISALNDFDYHAALRQISFLYRGTIVKSVEGIDFK